MGLTMGRIRGRIEVLEKAASARRTACRGIANKALESLSHESVELLIGAFGAERIGRRLTERESGARKAYAQALKQQCQAARLNATVRYEHIDYLPYAITMALARKILYETLELVQQAIEHGGELSEAESEAVELYVAESERLYQLAGFQSAAEFEAFRAAGGER